MLLILLYPEYPAITQVHNHKAWNIDHYYDINIIISIQPKIMCNKTEILL